MEASTSFGNTSIPYVTSFAGSTRGSSGYVAGTSIGTYSKFHYPQGVAYCSANDLLYVGDTSNNIIRVITSEGFVSTLAGGGGENNPGYSNGLGTYALFNEMWAVTIGSGNVLLVADANNNAIRSISIEGMVSTVAGSVSSSGQIITGAQNGTVYFHMLIERPHHYVTLKSYLT